MRWEHVTFLRLCFSYSPAMCNGFSIIQGHVVTMTKSIVDRSAHPKQNQTQVTSHQNHCQTTMGPHPLSHAEKMLSDDAHVIFPSKTLPNNMGTHPSQTSLKMLSDDIHIISISHDPNEEARKLPYGVYKLQEEDQKPITPCGRRVHRGNGGVKSLLSINRYK